MNSFALLSFISAGFSASIGLVVILRGRRSTANGLFFAGMICLAAGSLFNGLSLRAQQVADLLAWQDAALIARSFLPGIWLCFSLTYSRGNYLEFLNRWRVVIAISFILPAVLLLAFHESLMHVVQTQDPGLPIWFALGGAGRLLNIFILVSAVLIIMNLEKTFRTAVGTMRWRIKFVVLGLGVIFGAKIYTASQTLLYSGINLSYAPVHSSAIILGCTLIAISYLRSGRAEIDVYPSHAFLYSSITVVVAGIYLLIVGVLASVLAKIGNATDFPVKSFLMLVGIVALAVVLMSDRVRQLTKRFVSRHFQRPLYDYRNVWRSFTEGTLSRVEQTDLCEAVATFTSGLFQALSVTIWLVDGEKKTLTFGASTSLPSDEGQRLAPPETEAAEVIRVFQNSHDPVDLDTAKEPWAETLRAFTPGEFEKGGHRVCLPIIAGGELLGLMTLGDRVSGIPYSVQDTDLLKCITDQAAACLRNIQLSNRLMQAKQLEAFQAMSAFFVHDLKNTASTLSLMLRNLPVHFNDPAFREDALRGISHTVTHINSLISRLSSLRQELAIKPRPTDLNQLVAATVKEVQGLNDARFATELQPLPNVRLDAEQFQKVVLNLLLNAREAVGKDGQVNVATSQDKSSITLSVRDNGCGIAPEFLERSLFRPFQTTKKTGIGIGMFQSKMIVEAHGGRIDVESTLGQGTTFRVILPGVTKTNEAETVDS